MSWGPREAGAGQGVRPALLAMRRDAFFESPLQPRVAGPKVPILQTPPERAAWSRGASSRAWAPGRGEGGAAQLLLGVRAKSRAHIRGPLLGDKE